jgi:prepilin-type N-terminal cleavage/methylation domain-containing protein/prepilin-type processing-associated H-X9-DG protein
MRKKIRKAFTLIELLIVIAIISLLTAILFPVFARAREQARKAACASNLRQIGMAVMQYVQDYDERYPMGRHYYDSWPTPPAGEADGFWFKLLQPYTKSMQVFVCPTAGKINHDSGGYGWNFCGTGGITSNGNGFGYVTHHVRRCTPGAVTGVSLSAVSKPAETFLVADPSSNGYSGNGVFTIAYSYKHYTPTLHGGSPYTNVDQSGDASLVLDYSGGGNYLFADGHVKFVQANRAYCSSMWNIDKTKTTATCSPFQP